MRDQNYEVQRDEQYSDDTIYNNEDERKFSLKRPIYNAVSSAPFTYLSFQAMEGTSQLFIASLSLIVPWAFKKSKKKKSLEDSLDPEE